MLDLRVPLISHQKRRYFTFVDKLGNVLDLHELWGAALLVQQEQGIKKPFACHTAVSLSTLQAAFSLGWRV